MSNATRRARFHSLEVAKVRRLTEESIEVTFAVPDHLRSAYQYAAGQYLALRTELAGQPVRRSYSICRPPRDGRISVAIKRDFGGVFSTWANDSLCAGDRIEVMTPQGAFTSNLTDLEGRHVVGLAAGSGRPPRITIAHGVRSDSTRDRLARLSRRPSHRP